MWTHFWDMHSGGSQKEDFANLYIEAPMDEATSVFYSRYGHNPERVSCTCCGQDYAISEGESLAQLTGYHRNCRHDNTLGYVEEPDTRYRQDKRVTPLDEYAAQDDVKVIYAHEIDASERHVHVPEEGYMWH